METYNLDTYNKGKYYFPYINQCVSYGDVYDFGTYGGILLSRLVTTLSANNKKVRNIYCFDSFKGLPKEKDDIPIHPDWEAGSFDVRKLYNSNNTEEIINLIKKRIPEHNPNFIIGYFEETLQDKLIQQYDMQPAMFISIDVDLYRSTIEALDFIFRNKLIQTGTYMQYDDWGAKAKNLIEGKFGNSKAHNEMIKKYNIKFERKPKTNTFKVINYDPNIS